MPTAATVKAFVETVEAGQYIEAIERYYAPNASMRENGAEPRVGREVLAENERGVMARFKSIVAKADGPAAIDGDRVAINWVFDFTRPDGGKVRLEEIAWQRWEADKVAEERFFYDPSQFQTPV